MISPKQKNISKQGIEEYLKVKSWKELREWHKEFTPTINDEMFRMYMISYCGEARKLYNEGRLIENHLFMLKENEMDTEEKEEIWKYQKKSEKEEKELIINEVGRVVDGEIEKKLEQINKDLDEKLEKEGIQSDSGESLESESNEESQTPTELHDEKLAIIEKEDVLGAEKK